MNTKKLAKLYGVILMTTSYIVMFLTFMIAYFEPTKRVLVTINTLGEANIELMLLIIGVPCVFLYFKDYIQSIPKKEKS